MLDHPELADVTIEFFQALDRPGRHDALHVAQRDAVFLFEDLAVFLRVEQAERGFLDR